jgi:hypothetical protein
MDIHSVQHLKFMRLKKALKACQKRLGFTEGLLNMVQSSQNEPEPKLPRSSNPDQPLALPRLFRTILLGIFKLWRLGDSTAMKHTTRHLLCELSRAKLMSFSAG